MYRIQADLPKNLKVQPNFVLVSFDSTRDTVSTLHEFRVAHKLDAQWRLLRGSPEDVRTLAMLLGVQYKQDGQGNFAHSNLITILNADGEIQHQRVGLQSDVGKTVQVILDLLK